MEIEADCIISPESCNKYGVDQRRSRSAERVKDFMDRGLMTHGGFKSQHSCSPLDILITKYSQSFREVHGASRRLDGCR